jgi:hypothetical protein
MLAMDLAHGESNNIFFLVTVAYACYYSQWRSSPKNLGGAEHTDPQIVWLLMSSSKKCATGRTT